jgi:phospholipid/cholesterol/gamma-HCH transport system permease protein
LDAFQNLAKQPYMTISPSMQSPAGGLSSLCVSLGNYALSLAKTVYDMTGLFYDTMIEVCRSGKKGYASSIKQIISQILFTGVEAFPLVGVIGLLCGITIIIQATTNMPKFGVGEYFGNILIIVVIRELGPFFTSLVVVGRSGAALAAFIGNMKISKEISALEGMGIDPVRFLVMPAFVAMVVSMVCLAVYFDVIAIIGGWCIARINVDIQFGVFIASVLDALSAKEIVISTFKNMIFGSIIAIVSCYFGLAVDNVRELPQVALKAVVSSMITTIVINLLVTIGFYT